MSDRFHSTYNPELQNAYGLWAYEQSTDQILAIAITDPKHAMAAFLGIARTGRVACLVTPQMADDLDERFTVLDTKLDGALVGSDIGAPTNFITFTSGSTNKPKAILRSPQSWIYSFARNGVTPDDTVAVLGSLSHSLAHYAACEALCIGADVVFCPRKAQGSPTVIYATPTQLRVFYANQTHPDVRLIMVGGGHFSASDYAHCARIFPNATVRVFYGTAETSFISIADEHTPEGSVGQAYDGVSLQVLNGAVSVQTPMLAFGYLGKIKKLDPSTPYVTGELGWMDQNGFLFLHGRADRAVTIADKTVYLDALEADLLALTGVSRAGVIALPDSKRGLRAYGAVMGADVSHPSLARVVTVPNWPELLSGKTDYVTLNAIIKRTIA